MTRTMLPYQRRWVEAAASLKVAEKGRRIGLSWAEAYAATMHAARRAGGNVYYQSYSLENALGFISDCADWAAAVEAAASEIGEVVLAEGDKSILAKRIEFASGHEILALTSAPRAIRSRGRPRDWVVIDEAAFVDDLDAVLKSATAFRVWGGSVHVISTHDGDMSPFASLCREVEEGRRSGYHQRTSFRDAVREGLYRRICEVEGREHTAADEDAWVEDIYAQYRDTAAEELDAIPSSGHGYWISWPLILAAEHTDAGQPDLYADGYAYAGVDIARRRDLWVMSVVEEVGDVLWVRDVQTRLDAPFSEHYQIMDEAWRRYRMLQLSADQTGMGEAPVEEMQARHPGQVEGVLMSGSARLDVATVLRRRFEDRAIRIPRSEELRASLRLLRRAPGPGGASRIVTAGRAGHDHADRAWSLALACAAADTARTGPVEGIVCPRSEAAGIHAAADPDLEPDAPWAGLPLVPSETDASLGGVR